MAEADHNLTMYFIEKVQPVSGKKIYIKNSDFNTVETIDASAVSIANSEEESTVTIIPTDPFYLGDFYVQIDEGAFVDLAGLPYAGISVATGDLQ